MKEAEWLGTYHPAGVLRNKTKLFHPFFHDIRKLATWYKGEHGLRQPVVHVPETREYFDSITKDWKDFAYDLETEMDKPVIKTIAVSDGWKTVVVDLNVGTPAWFISLFQKPGLRIVQNGAFDIPILAHYGITFDYTQTFDTMIAAHALYPDEFVNLSYLCSLNLDVPAWKDLKEDLLAYNATDAHNTYHLAMVQRTEIASKGMKRFVYEHLMPLLWEVIIPLNQTSLNVDLEGARTELNELKKGIKRWAAQMTRHFKSLSAKMGADIAAPIGKGLGFSYPLMKELLYGHLKLPVVLDGHSKNPSTNQATLQHLESKDASRCDSNCSSVKEGFCPGTVTLLLQRSRLKETETALKSLVGDGKTGTVSTRFVLGGDEKASSMTKGNQPAKPGPRTGRLASREPNLHNVPKAVRRFIVSN